MKTLIFMFFLLCAFCANAQNYNNKLSFSPIKLLGFNQLNVDFERGFMDGRIGIFIDFAHTGNATRKVHGQYSYLSEQSFGLKRYTKSFDKTCFWYGGMFSVASGNIFDENRIDSATNIGALGILGSGGYQILVKQFYLGLYLNFGYAITNDLFGTAEYTEDMGKPTDFLLTYGFKMGFTF